MIYIDIFGIYLKCFRTRQSQRHHRYKVHPIPVQWIRDLPLWWRWWWGQNSCASINERWSGQAKLVETPTQLVNALQMIHIYMKLAATYMISLSSSPVFDVCVGIKWLKTLWSLLLKGSEFVPTLESNKALEQTGPGPRWGKGHFGGNYRCWRKHLKMVLMMSGSYIW